METSNDTSKVIGALLLGAAIGGTLGILFAPDKGSKTRKKLMAKSDNITDAIQDKFDDFLEGVNEEIEAMKKKANGFMDNGAAKTDKPKTHA